MVLPHRYPLTLVIPLIIGISALGLQPVRAQSSAVELTQIDAGDIALGRWVANQSRLGSEGWQVIWQRFLAMGACADHFVGSGLLAEKDRKLRLVLAGACLVTTGHPEKTLFHRRIASRQHSDRIMSMMVLALGPRQPGDGKNLAAWVKRAKSPLEEVAGCLALARFPKHAAALPDAVAAKAKDAGVLAAALYCHPARSVAWVRDRTTHWSSRDQQAHAHLVWRGYLLGSSVSKPADEDRRKLAREALQTARRDVLPEAAYFLGRDGGVPLLDKDILQQPVEIKLHLAANPKFRERLLRNVDIRLRGTTSDLLLRRWWSLFSRYAPMDSVVTALQQWRTVQRFQEDDFLRTSIGLSLAWRLFSAPPVDTTALQAEIGPMTETAAGVWLELALGQKRTAAIAHQGFEDLAQAYPLASTGRLPHARIGKLLEAALWREGGHPRRMAVDLHRQWQAELLIDGNAAPGGGYAQARSAEIYTAKGVARGDSPLFLVANQFFRFICRQEPWSLQEYRLEK